MSDKYFIKSHEWIDVQDDIATVGITDYAQKQLGDVVFVELPEVGDEIEADDELAVVESVKAASEVYAPVSGEIVEANAELDDAPETINSAPETKGWIAKIKMSDKSQLDAMLDEKSYLKFVEELD